MYTQEDNGGYFTPLVSSFPGHAAATKPPSNAASKEALGDKFHHKLLVNEIKSHPDNACQKKGTFPAPPFTMLEVGTKIPRYLSTMAQHCPWGGVSHKLLASIVWNQPVALRPKK